MGLISLTFLNSLDLRRDTPYTCISPDQLRASRSYPVTGLETEIETRLRRREDKMAHVEIDVGSLPQPQRMAAGKPTVTIGGNGQVRMSSKATEALGESATHAKGYWDKDSRKLSFRGIDKVPVKGPKPFELGRPSNGKGKYAYFSASGLFQSEAIGILYDYRKAGTQIFDATVDEKKRVVSFTVPAETPEPRVTVPRPRKPKVAPPTQEQAEAAATAAGEDDGNDLGI